VFVLFKYIQKMELLIKIRLFIYEFQQVGRCIVMSGEILMRPLIVSNTLSVSLSKNLNHFNQTARR